MTLVEARNIAFRYRSDWVLRDISFTLNRGEFLGLIGPNGSGKTTLLKIINGVLTPQQGEVLFAGRSLSSWDRKILAQRLAVVGQETPVDFPFTVLELVLMGRYPHLALLEFEKERDVIIAQQAMESVHVSHLANRRLAALSSGERQRALVARALSQQPICLLMDEPTAFLDLRHQLDLFVLTRKLVREDNLGALIISHDINLAAQFCDRLLVLDRGRLVVQGTPEEVVCSRHLEPVYKCRLYVDRSPVSGKPRITPLPSAADDQL
ncbi:MAG: ABC transporter ATP-binding protein [Deltaproteobacteria bacterium]|nr:ABC transporter ATP-binding protein [Deltaproteobacteria bacterium]MBW2071512.1 ABC transporter ATP-binding protein [Deltaproteobacteria bacterium]